MTPDTTTDAILTALERLIAVVAQLRDPEGGCPWDLEQTPQTLIPYVIEEAYEVVHALRQEEQAAIAEELGDLLLQVILQAQIAQEYQQFNLADVANGICEKLIRRHPHVFGEARAATTAEVRKNWDAIKAEEKGESAEKPTPLSKKLARHNNSGPPLQASLNMSEAAAAAGFEWPDIGAVWAKFEEELQEFKEAMAEGNLDHQQAELGDLFFTLVNLARWYGLDPSEALYGTNQRMIQRIQHMEDVTVQPLSEVDVTTLNQLWQEAKAHLQDQQ